MSNNKVRSFSTGYKVEKPEAQLLNPGQHHVVVVNVVKVNDRMVDLKGTMKTPEQLKASGVDYDDFQTQYAIVFASKEGKGVLTDRLNEKGFVRYDMLPDTKGFRRSTHREGYAVSETTNKRLADPTKSEACMRIADSFFTKAGLEKGQDPEDVNGRELLITVTQSEFNGKLRNEIDWDKTKVYSSTEVEQTEEIEEEF